MLRLDDLLPPVLVRQFQGSIRALRLQQDMCRVKASHYSESATLLRGPEFHFRTPFGINQSEHYCFRVAGLAIRHFESSIFRMHLDACPHSTLFVNDFELAATEYRRHAVGSNPPDLRQ